MRLLSMVCFSILILVGCSTINPAVVVPPMEKYCPRPVRPVIEQKDVWDMQSLMRANLTIIDYTLKLEATLECYSLDKKK
jgi:PBP1b-binding outer membrane lipoprotein LpoB